MGTKVDNNMIENSFACIADKNYFVGIWSLINSIYAYHGDEYPVFVFDLGLTGEQIVNLKKHPVNIHVVQAISPDEYKGNVRKLFFDVRCNLFSYLIGKVKHVYMIDADIVLTSKMDDVFQLAEKGKIVTNLWKYPPVNPDEFEFIEKDFRSYGDSVVGKRKLWFQASVFCFDVIKHWDLACMFEQASRFAQWRSSEGYPVYLKGKHEQEMLRHLCVMLNKESCLHQFSVEDWSDSRHERSVIIRKKNEDGTLVVRRKAIDRNQRLLHNTPSEKWWMSEEGLKKLAGAGDKLECFQHFYKLIKEK